MIFNTYHVCIFAYVMTYLKKTTYFYIDLHKNYFPLKNKIFQLIEYIDHMKAHKTYHLAYNSV